MRRCGVVYNNDRPIYSVGPFDNIEEAEKWLYTPLNNFCIKKIYRSKAEMKRDWPGYEKKLDRMVPAVEWGDFF